MVLRQQSGNTQTHVACAGYGDANILKVLHITELY